jgi:flagellar hook-length control protein FliK
MLTSLPVLPLPSPAGPAAAALAAGEAPAAASGEGVTPQGGPPFALLLVAAMGQEAAGEDADLAEAGTGGEDSPPGGSGMPLTVLGTFPTGSLALFTGAPEAPPLAETDGGGWTGPVVETGPAAGSPRPDALSPLGWNLGAAGPTPADPQSPGASRGAVPPEGVADPFPDLAGDGTGFGVTAEPLPDPATAAPAVTPGPHALPGASRAPEGPPGQTLSVPVAAPRWGSALAERVLWMVRGDSTQVELRLNPPDLGPLEVRIALVDDTARISFAAPQAAVREAVEGALPRLREMLGANGFNLVHVDVSHHGGGERPPADRAGTMGEVAPVVRAGSPAGRVAAAMGEALRLGLVDAYA